MRNIKFRAWDVRNSQMIYQFEIGAGNGRPFFIGKPKEYWNLMQSTELTDKNGKLIYEGDIVEVKVNKQKNENLDDDLGVLPIVWTNAGLFLEGYTNDLGWQCDNFDIEVIGNIYEKEEPTDKEIERWLEQ